MRLKWLGWLLVLVAVLVAGVLPGATGYLTERELLRSGDHLQAQAGVTLEWRTYRRGWFTTQALARLSGVRLPGQVNSAAAYDVQIEVSHGPLTWRAGPVAGWLAGTLQARDPEFGQDLPAVWQADFKVGLLGSVSFSDTGAPLTLPTAEGGIAASGWEGTGQLRRDGALVYRGQWPSADVKTASAALNIQQLTLETVALPPGADRPDWSLQQLKLSVQKAAGLWQGDEVQVTGLQLQGSLQPVPHSPLIDAQTVLQAASASVLGETLRAVQLELSAERVPPAFVDAAQQALQSAQGGGPVAMALAMLAPITEQLLPNAPRITVDSLSFRTDAGAFNGNVRIDVDPKAATMQSVLELPAYLTLDLIARADRPLAQHLWSVVSANALRAGQFEAGQALDDQQIETQAQIMAAAQLDQFVDRGLLFVDGDALEMNLHYDQAGATLNGAPVALPF